jgi:CspA family cold shock protein
MLYGTVTVFDDAKGLGSITADDGTAFDFHCIEIADGTRTIEPDRRVAFERLARFGRFEASAIAKV